MSCDLLAGWVGGAAGVAASHPLDIARVRIQVHSGTTAAPNATTVIWKMVRAEGVRSLSRGIASPLLTVGAWKALIFAASEQVKTRQHRGPTGFTLLQESVAGFVGGAAGNFLQAPMEVVKCRAQVDLSPPSLAGEWRVAGEIVATHGWTGLFRGLPLLFLNSPSMVLCGLVPTQRGMPPSVGLLQWPHSARGAAQLLCRGARMRRRLWKRRVDRRLSCR